MFLMLFMFFQAEVGILFHCVTGVQTCALPICDHKVGMTLTARPIDPAPLANDRVYRQLRSRIMHGDIPPAQALTLRGIGQRIRCLDDPGTRSYS